MAVTDPLSVTSLMLPEMSKFGYNQRKEHVEVIFLVVDSEVNHTGHTPSYGSWFGLLFMYSYSHFNMILLHSLYSNSVEIKLKNN